MTVYKTALDEFEAEFRALIERHDEKLGADLSGYILALLSEWCLDALRAAQVSKPGEMCQTQTTALEACGC